MTEGSEAGRRADGGGQRQWTSEANDAGGRVEAPVAQTADHNPVIHQSIVAQAVLRNKAVFSTRVKQNMYICRIRLAVDIHICTEVLVYQSKIICDAIT